MGKGIWLLVFPGILSQIISHPFIITLTFFFQLPEGSVSAADQSLSMTIPSCSVGLAYLWEVTPVLGTAALPMYAKIGAPYGLPGAPWVREVGPLFI